MVLVFSVVYVIHIAVVCMCRWGLDSRERIYQIKKPYSLFIPVYKWQNEFRLAHSKVFICMELYTMS